MRNNQATSIFWQAMSLVFTPFLLLMLTLLISLPSAAQSRYSISGKVTDSLNRPVSPATVFIVGMTKMATTKADGTFQFNELQSGTYQLAVSMIGFAKHTETVLVTGESVELQIGLHPAAVELAEVVISTESAKARESNYKIFQQVFLGTSDNAKKCRITNPEVIHVKLDKKTGMLKAHADDLIVVENEALGYRLRYLLNNFNYHIASDNASFSGNTTFEELPGDEKQKTSWAAARSKAYYGSLMQFFRGLYRGNTRKEGFLISQAFERVPRFGGNDEREYVAIDPNEIDLHAISKMGLDSLMRLKFTKLFITYAPKQAAKEQTIIMDAQKKEVPITSNCSLIYLLISDTLIDQKGDTAGQHNFTVQGNIALRRVADQLPYEYNPAKAD